MKGLSSAALIAVLALAAPAEAAVKKFRHTLFVPVGQKTLMLEAPRGMCFLDQTSNQQKTLFKEFAATLQKKRDQVLLAVFTGCNNIANLGESVSTADVTANSGTVSWLNPSVGEATTLERADYLDMREASFRQYTENNADGQSLDENIHRNKDNVSLGMKGEIKKSKSVSVLATTSIQHIPIQVSIRYTGKDNITLEKVYPMMDKFMAQQIALNE